MSVEALLKAHKGEVILNKARVVIDGESVVVAVPSEAGDLELTPAGEELAAKLPAKKPAAKPAAKSTAKK